MEIMGYDVSRLCKEEERREEGRTWFTVNPHVMYPETIARIKEVLETGDQPKELFDAQFTPGIDPTSAAKTLVAMAKAVLPIGWTLAIEGPILYSEEDRVLRAAALECARLWFTQAMQVKYGSIGIHIFKGGGFYKL